LAKTGAKNAKKSEWAHKKQVGRGKDKIIRGFWLALAKISTFWA
jgi:hypothetical protein